MSAEASDEGLQEAIALGMADVEAGRLIDVTPEDIEELMLAAIRERQAAAE